MNVDLRFATDALCDKSIGLLGSCELDAQVRRAPYIDSSTLYDGLQLSIKTKDLALGKRVHTLTIQSGLESNSFLANHLICMYTSHGRLEEAMLVFTKAPSPSRQMWASIILSHARHGQAIKAIQLYRRVKQCNVRPDNHIFAAALKACATASDLASGKEVHADTSTAVHPIDVLGMCSVVWLKKLYSSMLACNKRAPLLQTVYHMFYCSKHVPA